MLLVIGFGAAAWSIWLVDLSWSEGATLLACEAAVTAASLFVVRLAGYRLVWHWHFRRPKP